MKKNLLFLMSILFWQKNYSQKIMIPDSIKATGIITDITIPKKPKNYSVSVQFGYPHINLLRHSNKYKKVHFNGNFISKEYGIGSIDRKYGNYVSDFKWEFDKTYKIYIATVKDSTKIHYASYFYLPNENKWKYMGMGVSNDTVLPKQFYITTSKKRGQFINNIWLQKEQGNWYAVNLKDTIKPKLRPFSNIDSVAIIKIEQKRISDSLKATATFYEGLYYTMLKEGTGDQVKITDTVVINYKGWLFSNGQIFDETKKEPATFPLNRLIQGWQIGVPLCKVGGKIRLYIPSGLAYGIRNIATTIPPNSILVFDVEVLEVKR
jgi:FKBP-type peptidyl-prolyl cis-trans isomerase FkpA